MSDETELQKIRERIDAIDLQLQELLNERAQCSFDVAKVKQASSSDDDPIVYYRPEREAQILKSVKDRNRGPLPDETIARLFREIISCSLSLEQPLTIAYLGPAGTYTEAATVKQFGHFAGTRALGSIDEVFREVESRSVHYGVVPVENSTEGMVNHTLDCFMTSQLSICAEVELPIHHTFLTGANTAVDDIKEIFSHQQSLAQCRGWLDSHYPTAERIAVSSNAEAARIAAEQPGTAAIAGEMAAQRYGLAIHNRNIEDQPDNKTRFLVIGHQDTGPSGHDKTSILVSTRNAPGALYKVLEPFHRHKISLSRIETRPAKSGDWSYVFFIDFDGHQEQAEIQAVLSEVGEQVLEVRRLGSYPRSVV